MFVELQPSPLRAIFVTGLILATSLTGPPAGPASPSQKTSSAQKAEIVENYGRLPLSFEANTGQADKSVRFLSRGRGYGLYLTGNEAVLTLHKTVYGGAKAGLQQHMPLIQKSAPSDVVRMQLAGASGKAVPRGEEPLPGTANYFIGDDPAKWHTRVPTYAKVRYTGIYPGIDLVYYGNPSADGQLEYDFVVAPGADPGVITLDVAAGLSRRPSSKIGGVPTRSGQVPPPLQIAADGDLVIRADGGAIRFHKPVVYQIVDGRRQTVAGDFALLAKHTVGFRLGSYNRAQALVIDPVLTYSTYLGGSGTDGDTANAITMDTAGNAYVTGETSSIDFPVTAGAYQGTDRAAAKEKLTAFVTKLNPSGTALVYSTYLGGSGSSIGVDVGNAIALDTAGNAYVAGQTYSTDFPVTPGAIQKTNKAAANGDANAFVTELNSTGAALVYSTYLGGSGLSVWTPYSGDAAHAIAVDTAGDAYVAGQTLSADFPATPGAFQTTNNGVAKDCANVFITKLSPAGTAILYSTYLGGSGGQAGILAGDSGQAIAVNAAGDAYVAGETTSTDFPVTSGAYQTTNNAAANKNTNAFVTKLNPTGTALVYSTYLGGSEEDIDSAIAVDTAGNVYLAGQAYSTDFPVTPGAFQTTNHSAIKSTNAFVAKLNPIGTALVYSTYLGGSGSFINLAPTLGMESGDQASGLAIDSSGNVYVTGSTASADFPVTQDAYQSTNNDQPGCAGGCIGGYNAFITELNPAGSALVYSTYLGGSGISPSQSVGAIMFGEGDQANALALDNSGNVYVAGSAISYDFPVTAGAFQTTVKSGSGNAFVTKLNMVATSTTTRPTVTVTPASTTITSARPLTVTVSVSGGSGSPTPTGTVTLVSGTYASAATTLNGGSATIDIPAGLLAAGYLSGDLLIAKYVPDVASSSTYRSASGSASVYVVAPSISVTPSSSYVWTAQSQAFPVAIVATGGTGNPVPTGTVTLTTGTYSSAATALSGGSATISIPPGTLTTGSNILDLSYSGDSNYTAVALAGSALVTVGPVTVSVVPSSSSINSTQRLPVTITLSAGSGNPTPTGMVILTSGSYSSLAQLVGGSATITIPAGALAPGVDILTAEYQGGGNYLGGASGQASVTVTVSPVTVSVAPSSSSIDPTQALPVTITVSAGNGSPTPTGTVTLASGTYTSAAVALVGGSATITIPAGTLAPGVDTLTGEYQGGNYTSGAFGYASVTVFGFTITGTAVTVAPGAITGNFSTITVTPAGSFTGTVTLKAALTSMPSGAQDLPTLSFGGNSPGYVNSPVSVPLFITTTAPSGCTAANLLRHGVPWYPAGGAALACVLLFGIPGQRRSWQRRLALLTLLVTLTCGALACGAGSGPLPCSPNSGTTAGTYIVTVTGTSGSSTATGTVTFTVQ